MRVNAYLMVTGVIFGVMSVLHVLRLIIGWPAALGPWEVPVAFSWAGALIAGALCAWSIVLLRQRS